MRDSEYGQTAPTHTKPITRPPQKCKKYWLKKFSSKNRIMQLQPEGICKERCSRR